MKSAIVDPLVFSTEILKLCKQNDLSIIDAIVFWCEKNKLEIEQVVPLIKKLPDIKSQIQSEAESLNIIKNE